MNLHLIWALIWAIKPVLSSHPQQVKTFEKTDDHLEIQ
jgi:hypothetical protein